MQLERYDPNSNGPRPTWLHPVSALVILGIDWLFFAEEAVTLGLAIPIACVLASVSSGLAVYWIQRRKGYDSRRKAMGKALFGALIAGFPTSLGGTIVGTVVLMMAGLRGLKRSGQERNPKSEGAEIR